MHTWMNSVSYQAVIRAWPIAHLHLQMMELICWVDPYQEQLATETRRTHESMSDRRSEHESDAV